MLEKLLNPYLLISLNLVIILVSEFSGGGVYFEESGLIHLIAVVFVLLCAYTVSSFRHLQGGSFFTIFKGFLIALALFSLVHIVEYLAVIGLIGERLEELADFNVMVFYAVGFISILIGFKNVLGIYHGSQSKVKLLYWMVVPMVLISFFVFIKGDVEFFGSEIILSLLMVALNVIIGALVIFKSLEIEKIMSMFKHFMRYMRYSFILVIVAVLFEFLEIFGLSFIPDTQITYLTHFAFYIALGFQLLAFRQLFNLGGVYEDLEKEIASAGESKGGKIGQELPA